MKNFQKKQLSLSALFILICVLSQRISARSDVPGYPVKDIPAELKTNAKAVIRNEERTLTITGIQNATLVTKYAITILNENGLRLGVLMEFYDKFHRIYGISGRIYNADGEKVEHIQLNDVIDHSAIAFASLYDDTRVKYFEPKYRTYPFTVEYEFVTEYFGLLDFPQWFPCREPNVSVQSSNFEISIYNPFSFRYYNKNYSDQPEIVKKGKKTTYHWKIENQPALAEETWSESLRDYAPGIIFAPDSFKINSYSGDISSWDTFGKWIRDINRGRDQISEDTRQMLQKLVKECPDEYCKAKRIYEFMQQKTRYISIQIGIGGWQPMKALDVDRMGYGDCKALANYLIALYRSVGIQSFYTLVMAGEKAPAIIREFPSQQFNHAIVCLPLQLDTIWIECTNQQIPFGYIGTFTDDRDVLVITENGGKIAHTKAYNELENLRTGNVVLQLDAEGDASVLMKRSYKGSFFDDKLNTLLVDHEQQKQFLYENLNLSGLTVDSFVYTLQRSVLPAVEESVIFSVQQYGNRTGQRMLVQINKFPIVKEIPKRVSNRRSDVIIQRPSMIIDTLTVILPENYIVESLPDHAMQQTVFGSFEYTCTQHGNSVLYIRRFSLLKGRHPSSLYPELIEFFRGAAVCDEAKMNLIRISN